METVEQLAHKLKLPYVKQNLKLLISESMDQQYSYEEFLQMVLSRELTVRKNNGIQRKISNARFPYRKTFADFHFEALPPEAANKIRELQSLRFMETGQNIILVGNPGVGKTHTAIALGLKACEQGKNVLFITVPSLITELKEAMSMNQVTTYKNRFTKYDLVILDELGYVSFDKAAGELLFTLLSQRNNTKSVIITTNIPFNRWQDIFGDPVLTTAMVDRLAYKAYVIHMIGDSYRLKETKAWLQNGN